MTNLFQSTHSLVSTSIFLLLFHKQVKRISSDYEIRIRLRVARNLDAPTLMQVTFAMK